MLNCTNRTVCNLAAQWKAYSLAFEMLVCACGVLGSIVCLWCLKTCDKTQAGTKIQLCSLFAANAFLCSLALPGAAVLELLFLQARRAEPATELAFVALYYIAACIDQMTLAVIAVYRLIAVCFPLKYKLWSRSTVVVAVEVALTLPAVLTLTLAFLFLKYEIIDPSKSTAGKALYVVFYLVPIIIILTAYCIMVSIMGFRRCARQGAEARNPGWDQISLSLCVLILMNLLLDVPHVTMHLMDVSWTEPSFVIVHAVYRLHFALDPVVFVGLNQRFRQRALQGVFSLVPGRRIPSSVAV
ncbi:uncharacterized protein LOC125033566 isoform X1 [Penaeus chinensis]|uniref:uncharacterized protein LOC125033566 isoform X1 n=1 Tax=Penaeus chinensis TaxID=139456 RepID=UPI001FB79B89|nr:uncharacterized protein LOC125033566 isoform X1 [Penaeus chinensis]